MSSVAELVEFVGGLLNGPLADKNIVGIFRAGEQGITVQGDYQSVTIGKWVVVWEPGE